MISKMKPVARGRLAGWRSSSTAHRCSPARPGRASRRSAGGSSRTTGSRPSSRCPTSSSTTPASPPTSGSSPTARAPSGAARSSLSTRASIFVKMRKTLGEKRKQISATSRSIEITRLYGEFAEGEQVKIFPNEAFGFLRITVERPLRLRWEVTDDTIASRCREAIAKLPENVDGCSASCSTEIRVRAFATQRELRQDVWPRLATLSLPRPRRRRCCRRSAVRDEQAASSPTVRVTPSPTRAARQRECAAAVGAGVICRRPDGALRDGRVSDCGRRLHAR